MNVGFWIVFLLGLVFSYTSDVWVGFNGLVFGLFCVSWMFG